MATKNCGRGGGRVRQYNKSEVPRLRWTPQLHQHFVQAVDQLGGKYKATPKRILQMMSVKGLKIPHIKSHLQMYRSWKGSDNIDLFVPVRHLRFRRASYGLFSNYSLSKRQCQERNFKQQNFSKRNSTNNSLLLMEEEAVTAFDHHQGKYKCMVGKRLKDQEDIGGVGEVCELSLSFTPSPAATIPKSQDDHKAYFGPLSHEYDLTHHLNNYINLDLTISTSLPD
ncbi:hypothetical protein DITRI_Ditri16bG0104400 [Diplodiscus trichospermus]